MKQSPTKRKRGEIDGKKDKERERNIEREGEQRRERKRERDKDGESVRGKVIQGNHLKRKSNIDGYELKIYF